MELPEGYGYGEIHNTKFLAAEAEEYLHKMEDVFGLSGYHLMLLARVGDRVIPEREEEEDGWADRDNWPEAEIVEALLVKVDELEAEEATE